MVIVSLPIKNGGSLHSYANVWKRLTVNQGNPRRIATESGRHQGFIYGKTQPNSGNPSTKIVLNVGLIIVINVVNVVTIPTMINYFNPYIAMAVMIWFHPHDKNLSPRAAQSRHRSVKPGTASHGPSEASAAMMVHDSQQHVHMSSVQKP